MSQIIKDQIINFVVHLNTQENPYLATADYLGTFLVPCSLPAWSRYLQRVFAVMFLIMFFQSIYVLYIRSKTKKIYHIGLNDTGLIQLDRANHCGLCYLLYSIFAIVDIICEELVQSGHLDQGWPNFILSMKLTLTVACASVILWLCICHCALPLASRCTTPARILLSQTLTWSLNTFLIIIIFIPAVPITISFYQVTMKYQHITQVVKLIIQIYRKSAHTCSLVKCGVTQILPQIVSHIQDLYHIDLLTLYTAIGLDSYRLISGLLLLIYVPFLFLLFKNFRNQRGMFPSTQQKQAGVLANTLLEFSILSSIFILASCAVNFVHKGDFIYQPKFWLVVRTGLNSVVSTLGNAALYLIICSFPSINVTRPPVVLPTFATAKAHPKCDAHTSL